MIAAEQALAALREAFARAGEVSGVHTTHLRLAGRRWTFRIAGDALAARTLAPIAHLVAQAEQMEAAAAPAMAVEKGPTPTELVVEIFCEAESGVAVPFGQPSRGIHSQGSRWLTHGDRGVLTCFDRERQLIAGWRAKADSAPEESWRPLPWLLPVWCLDRGGQVVHAGLVAEGEVGALLVGEGGAGKSTTALACAAAGLRFLGDDFVVVEETAEGWIGHSISRAARVGSETLAANPELAAGLDVGEAEGKSRVMIEAARARASVRIERILLPRIGGNETRLLKVSRRDALVGFLPTTLVGTPGSGAERMARLGRLTREVPATGLQLAGSPADAAVAVRAALRGLG